MKPSRLPVKPMKRKPLKASNSRLNASRTRVKKETISTLMKEADRLMSIKVRSMGAWESEEGWLNRCYTHDVDEYRILPVKKLQNGHYLSRWYKAARWDFDNCRPQCYVCNMRKKGMPVEFRHNLIKEIGLERVEAVEAKRHVSTKLTKEYLKNLITSLEN